MREFRQFQVSSLLVLLFVGQLAVARPFGPVRDETNRIPEFAPFVAQLKQAVNNTLDAAFIRSIITSESTVYPKGSSPGGRRTREQDSALRQQFVAGLDDPQAQFWQDMSRYLRWGCGWSGSEKTVCYPSWYQRRDLSLDDVVVTGITVNIRSAPGLHAKVILSRRTAAGTRRVGVLGG